MRLLWSKGSLPNAHRSQYYGKRKGFIVKLTGKKTGGKPQICLPDPEFGKNFKVLERTGGYAEALVGQILTGADFENRPLMLRYSKDLGTRFF